MNSMRTKLIAIATVLGALAVCQLHAGTMTLNTNVWSGVSRGGQFTATLDTGEIFQTFCLEYYEEFSPGVSYNYQITGAAISGDQNLHGGPTGTDPISKGTAALYKAFRNGTLTDYFSNDVATQKANADILQKALWFLEDETFAQDQNITNNKYLNDLSSFGFTTLADAMVNYDGTDVAVLNLTTSTGGPAQDQLYLRTPDGGTTIALLGAALLAIAAFRRRLV